MTPAAVPVSMVRGSRMVAWFVMMVMVVCQMGMSIARMVVDPVMVIVMVSSKVASLVDIANPTDVALEPRETMGVAAATVVVMVAIHTLVVVNMGVAEDVQAVAASLVRLVVVARLVVAVLDTLDRLAAHLVVAQDTQDILVAWDTQLVVAQDTQDTLVASHLVVDLGSSLDS